MSTTDENVNLKVDNTIDEIAEDANAAATPKRIVFPNRAAYIKYQNSRSAIVKDGGRVRIIDPQDPRQPGITVRDAKDFYAPIAYKSADKKSLAPGFVDWLASADRLTYDGIEFQPNLSRAKSGWLNLFKGFAIQPVEGDCAKVRHHILNNICQGDRDLYEYVMDWAADAIQHPDRKNGVMLVMLGEKGCGKTTLSDLMADIIGRDYVKKLDRPDQLTGTHNAHLHHCLLVQVEEGFWAGDRSANGQLKNLATSGEIFVNPKHKDGGMVESFHRVIVTSNEDWVIPFEGKERRDCVIRVGSGAIGDDAYWSALYAELNNGGREAFRYVLEQRDLSKRVFGHIPHTDAAADQAVRGLSAQDAWWWDILCSGELVFPTWSPADEFSWATDAGVIVSKEALYQSFAHCAPGYRSPPSREVLGRLLRKLCPDVTDTKTPARDPKERKNAFRLPARAEAIQAMLEVHPFLPAPLKVEAPEADEAREAETNVIDFHEVEETLRAITAREGGRLSRFFDPAVPRRRA